jgi:gliding motility-associated-like protein
MLHKISDDKFFLFIFICFASCLNNLKAENGNINFPSFFMTNQGQFSNGSQYCLKSAKSNTFFFNQYIVHQFVTAKNKQDTINPDILNLRIDFENSNPNPVFEERDPLTSTSNFFIGSDAASWKTDIASFASLAYNELYSKIDLVYYSAKGIKSDFVVHPGGNYSDIMLKYSGIKDISISPQGALKICTDAGEITEHIPEAYQMINGAKVIVNVNFKIKNRNTVNFEVEDYNPDYDLVIDPQLVYCSYFGGSGDEAWPTRIIRDSQQNIYFAGKTRSANFPVTPGTFSTGFSGDYDVFVIKLNPTGTQLIFSTFIGGPGLDIPSDMKLVGPSNEILLLGLAGAEGFPTTPGAFQTHHAGLEDFYVLKLNNSGNSLIFSTLVGGISDEEASGICLDNAGDIYVLGYAGYYFPTTPGAYQQTLVGDYDVCVFKLSANGSNLLYSTFIGGPDRDRSSGIALDNFSNVYISSWVLGSFPTTPGAYDHTFNGDIDIAVSKFDPTLSTLIFSTLIGGPGDDRTVSDVILDNDNNITLVGQAGNGFPTTAGSYDPTFNGGYSDAFVVKVNNTGTKLLYSSFLGSPGSDYARDVSKDAAGNLLITGSCENGFPLTSCPYDDTYNGGNSDCFISKIDINTSTLLYSTYLGTSGDESGEAIINSGDTLLVAGETSSSGLPVTANAFDPTFNGGENDIFLVKLTLSSGLNPVAKFNNSSNTCLNQPVSFINGSLNSTAYFWNFGDGNSSSTESPTHSYFQPGSYLVKLIASNLCSKDTIAYFISIKGSSAKKAITICEGDSVFIDGLYRYNSGNYNEVFQSTSGCDSIISTNLAINPTYQTSLIPSICEGETFMIGTQIYSISGIYSDLLKTSSGCDSIITINLTVNPLPVPRLGNDTLMCPGELIVLTPGNSFSKYLWSDGSELSILQVSQPGSYFVNVFDGLCSASDTISINGCGTELWFPNVFTPNNDGLNERFKPVSQGVITSYQILIFNRWGQQLYESNEAYTGWNGTFNGNLCPEGTYFYVAEYSVGTLPSTLKQSTKRGAVTLLR